jgi:hypothetical protein
MADEYTVERAAKELRQMFPHAWFFVALRLTWPQGSASPSTSAVIEIERESNGFYSPYLHDAMAQIKKWRESQS